MVGFQEKVVEILYKQRDIEHQAILDWLTSTDYTSQQSDSIRRRQPGTGEWLLESNEFQEWVTQIKQILFCPGIPGAGKTIITSIVVDNLCRRFQDDTTVGIAYIYCNFRLQQEQDPTELLLSLLKQFAQGQPTIPDCVKKLHGNHKQRTRPSLDEILDALKSIITGYSKAFIIIDALDEYKSSDGFRSTFMSEIFSLQAETRANLFATSRFIPDIENEFKGKGAISLEIRASDDDVRRYLDGHISRLPLLIQENCELEDKVKAAIVKAAGGMYVHYRPF